MDGPRYILAVIAVISLGTAAGAFVHHREGSSYAIPIALAVVGILAAIAAWKLRPRPKK
jgi:uncharacterized membrane-anchored protein